ARLLSALQLSLNIDVITCNLTSHVSTQSSPPALGSTCRLTAPIRPCALVCCNLSKLLLKRSSPDYEFIASNLIELLQLHHDPIEASTLSLGKLCLSLSVNCMRAATANQRQSTAPYCHADQCQLMQFEQMRSHQSGHF